MRFFLIGSLFVSMLIFGSAISFAQGLGTLSGKVTDAVSGKVLAGAKVFIVETFEEIKTDGEGGFQIQLEPGHYSVLIDHEGFESSAQKIEIKLGTAVVIEIGLKPQ